MITPSRMRGVSLIELAITLSVLALSVFLAVPSWQQLQQKRDVTAAAEQLAAFLQTVQGAAVLHNEQLTVSLVHNDATDWCVGATLGGAACDCTVDDPIDSAYCAIDEAAQRVIQAPSGLSRMPGHSADTAFTFEPVRGLMINADLGNRHYFNLATEHNEFGLRVNMHPTGRVRICNFSTAGPVPGYADCPADGGFGISGTSP